MIYYMTLSTGAVSAADSVLGPLIAGLPPTLGLSGREFSEWTTAMRRYVQRLPVDSGSPPLRSLQLREANGSVVPWDQIRGIVYDMPGGWGGIHNFQLP